MKKILSLFAAVLFAGSMFAVDAEILKGETNSYDDVTINGQPAIKMGKSSAGGDMYINLGAGAKILTLHVVAWNKEGGAKVFIDTPEGITADPAELELVANENIAGSGKDFTLEDEDAYKFQIALSGVEAPCTLTLRSEKRAIVWAASYETDGEITPPEPADTYTVAGAPESVFGSYWDPTDANNDMVLKDGLYTWEKKVYLTAGTKVEFKIVKNHSWDVSYPDDNVTATVDEDGEYLFPISFQTENNQIFAALHKVEEGAVMTCAEAAQAARDGKTDEVSVQGYVTEIAYPWKDGSMSFWMADTKDGGQVFEAYRCECAEADAPEVGDLVKASGKLTYYEKNDVPELAAGCTVEIIEKGQVEPQEPEIPIKETWFADANWAQEFESTAEYDAAGKKLTVSIRVDKASQWQGQVKLQGPIPEAGKFYRVALKMKANNAVGGITLKWQDNNNVPNVIFENQTINLEAGVEFAFDQVVEAVDGENGSNGILVLDFGWAHAGDIIEIYDIVIAEAPAPLPDPTNCAEAAEAALSVSENNEPFNGGKVYTIRGYVTGIKTEYSEQFGNISFWMADEAEGGEVLQAYRCVPEAADKLPEVGDLVEVTGSLTKYGSTPEFAAGCTVVILAKQGVENTAATVKAVKVIRDGQVLILKGDKTFNLLGTEIK